MRSLPKRSKLNYDCHQLRVQGLGIRELFVGRLADCLQQLLLADGRARFLREFDCFVAHSSFPSSCGFASTLLVTASEHFCTSTLEVLGVVVMLVEELLQTVANHLRSVEA